MTDRHLDLVHMTHLNAIVDGYQDSIDHFRSLYGAQLNMEIPGGEVDACLINIGRVIFELFAPRQRAERGQGRLLALYGDHYIGVEYQVPDLEAAREVLRAKGIRILSDAGIYLLTHPADSHGVSLELYEGDWHAEPPPAAYLEPIRPAAYWRDEHPLGITGLARYSVAVTDLDGASALFRDLTGAEEVHREARPAAGAEAVGLRIADTVVELIAPTGDGSVARYLDRYGQRIRATTFAVADPGRVEAYFAERGITLVPGDAPGALAVPPEANHGLLFEFTG